MAETARHADDPPDPAHQELELLVERIAELERALANANRYLEACREVVGAREGELLIDAIRRRTGAPAEPPSR